MRFRTPEHKAFMKRMRADSAAFRQRFAKRKKTATRKRRRR